MKNSRGATLDGWMGSLTFHISSLTSRSALILFLFLLSVALTLDSSLFGNNSLMAEQPYSWSEQAAQASSEGGGGSDEWHV